MNTNYIFFAIRKYAFSVYKYISINYNYALNKEYIFNPYEWMLIETSGICNLRCKFCAYEKKVLQRIIMNDEDFCNYVNQALEIGYKKFDLTPLTGEIFVDKSAINKLKYLENNPRVLEYKIVTNLIPVNINDIDELFTLNKLKEICISLYGHDLESFLELTRGRKNDYYKLIINLKEVKRVMVKKNSALKIALRTYRDYEFNVNNNDSDLIRIVKEIKKNKNVFLVVNKIYSNWGGLINESDLKKSNIKVAKIASAYKKGACSLLFNKIKILSDGKVNACGCMDANGSLIIGELKKNKLSDILSINNMKYFNIIKNQQSGYYNKVCKQCDMYRSIYLYHPEYFKKKVLRLDEYLNVLKKRFYQDRVKNL